MHYFAKNSYQMYSKFAASIVIKYKLQKVHLELEMINKIWKSEENKENGFWLKVTFANVHGGVRGRVVEIQTN